MKKIFFLLLMFVLLHTCGCMSEIAVQKSNRLKNLEYDRLSLLTRSGLNAETENLLADYLLMEDFKNDPDKVIRFLVTMFRRENKAQYLYALADVSLRCGRRFHHDPDRAIRYYLPAAVFSYAFLCYMDDPQKQPYRADRVMIIHLYNTATAEIFSYLNRKKLFARDGYSIDTVTDMKITFEAPDYQLPLPGKAYRQFKLCCDYETKNLTHTTRHFGLGVPLICDLERKMEKSSNGKNVWAKDQALPSTMYIHFKFDKKYSDLKAQLVFCDVREQEEIRLASRTIPLALDFSTPIAYMANNPMPLHHLLYMLHPDDGEDMKGLYKFESFNENRIPVVLVHGLMSNTRTWMQMFNTLQNDPDIRKHYQFWGYSYSSGIPVLYTAGELRKALTAEREKLVKQGKSTEKFDRMVLIGHSMGGLLCKTALMDSDENFGKGIMKASGAENVLKKLDREQQEYLKSFFHIRHLDFVKRVIFIAVPHRGSDFAAGFIGYLGRKFIRLPVSMVSSFNRIIKNIFPGRRGEKYPTGIDNLMPDSAALQELMKLSFRKGIPYHSIIGNRKKAGIPSGSDGIVPYSSSHLDGAESELVVRSGHSVQQNPLAIQEVRRILLAHLQNIKDEQNKELHDLYAEKSTTRINNTVKEGYRSPKGEK